MGISGIEFGNRLGNGINVDSMREKIDAAAGADEVAESGDAKSFGDFMKDLANDANTSQLTADAKLQDVAAGRNKDLHGAVLAMEKADVQFKLITQVRNKVIDAYREIMRMQV